jgi:hypothetical protein
VKETAETEDIVFMPKLHVDDADDVGGGEGIKHKIHELQILEACVGDNKRVTQSCNFV